MDIKYNIYYSANANGPWTLANSTPIDHQDDIMSYFIDGTEPRTRYFIRIIGGYLDDDSSFIALQSQSIGPFNTGVDAISSTSTDGAIAPLSIEVVTAGPNIRTNSEGLSHTFTVV